MTDERKEKCFSFTETWSWLIVVCLGVGLIFFLCEQVEAKKRKRAYSPVKVERVVTSPDPFIIGQSPLTISMMVQLPTYLKGPKVLEVSTLITSPTRRSMSFVSRRILLDEQALKKPFPTFPVDLLWDGKDQHDQYVADGSYFYEIQAKVMDDTGDGPRTKLVSRRVQGTLKALAYVGEVLPPVEPEPDPIDDVKSTVEEEAVEDDLPVVEEGLKVEDDPKVPKEENGSESVELAPGVVEGASVDPQITDENVEEKPESMSEERIPEIDKESISESSTSFEEIHSTH